MMIKTLFTLVIRRPDQHIGFQMQKLIQMPYLVREGETLEWTSGGDGSFLDVTATFFNLKDEHLNVALDPTEGSDWHYKYISAEEMPDIQAQLETDGWVKV